MNKFILENNKEVFFSEAEFYNRSAKVTDEFEVIMDPHYASGQSYPIVKVKLSNLKPTTKKINISDVYVAIARNKYQDLVISKDNYVISDNLILAMLFAIWGFDSYKEVDAYIVNMTLDELIDTEDHDISVDEEGYGVQGPSQVPGMGDVKFPSTSDVGSGDLIHGFYLVPTTIDKNRTIDDGFFTETDLKKYKDFISQDQSILEQEELEVHFDSSEGIEGLETCINIPVKRQFKQIDTDFSCKTLEGITHGKAGDYLVVGVDGEIYPCDKEVFEKTYQKIDEVTQK